MCSNTNPPQHMSAYMKYKYGIEVGPGKRVAMEIKRALRKHRLNEVVT